MSKKFLKEKREPINFDKLIEKALHCNKKKRK